MKKNTVKRILSLMLALVMLYVLCPGFSLEASATDTRWDVINMAGIDGSDIVAQARTYLDVPYDTSGGNYKYRTGFGDKMMFDCSGFVYRVCRDVGLASSRKNYSMGVTDNEGNPLEGQDAYGNYYITAHTLEQRYYGEDISAAVNKYLQTGDYSDLCPGDLLFISNKSSRDYVAHVVIYAGDGKIIHSEGYEGRVAEHDIGRYHSNRNKNNWYFAGCRLVHTAHTYNAEGYCKNCNYRYPWENTKSTSCAGNYKVTLSGGAQLNPSAPYSETEEFVPVLACGTQIYVHYRVTNGYNETWYYATYKGVSGFVRCSSVGYVKSGKPSFPVPICLG